MKIGPDLKPVAKAAREVERAERRLATRILEAQDGGYSLRAISLVAGISHEAVRAVIARERQRIADVEAALDRPIAALGVHDRAREEGQKRRLARSLPVNPSDE